MQTAIDVDSNQFESIWQEYIPALAWGTIALGISVVLGFYLTFSNALTGHLPYPIATIICSYLMFASFTVMHDAGHGGIIKSGSKLKPLESVIGWMASLPLLIAPYKLFQKIHDRHHAFTNDPDRDPDHYTFANSWWGLIINSLYIPVQYHVLAFTKLRGIKVIRETYASTMCYLFFTLGGLLAFSIAGYGLEVLCLAIIPNMVAVFFLAMFFDYIPHHPHKSRDRYHDSRIYPSRLLNLVLLGQNYHLIHHMYPRLPWYRYKEVYHRILPYLEIKDAPIEDISVGVRPGFMKSPSVSSLLSGGRSINMVLEVSELKRLTFDAVSVTFQLPKGERLDYKAGQYITVSKWLAGEQRTRCYSLCAGPEKGVLRIAVRRNKHGVVSSYINDELKVGDKMIVQGPFGEFTYPAKEAKETLNLTLIAGGSGITPILSIIEESLTEPCNSSITLIYVCHCRDSIMFFDELERLKQEHPERFKVQYVIGRTSCHSILSNLVSDETHDEQTTDFYICGPQGLKEGVLAVLAANGVPEAQIHVEQFEASLTQPAGPSHEIDILLSDGSQHSLVAASNQTILEVAKYKGIQIPHACGLGTCGSCKFQVNRGESTPIPDTTPGLTVEEKQAGIVLACQCKPLEDMSISEV